MGLRAKLVPRGSRRHMLAMQVLRRAPYVASRRAERRALVRSWAEHKADDLDQYLVSGYQDPRINAQSILTRHFLAGKVFGADEFVDLEHRELDFCVRMNAELRKSAAELDVPMRAYLDPGKRAMVARAESAIEESKNTYEELWARELANLSANSISVLELACGSANDYRFFASYGLARFLDYTGIDLNPKNIENARARFPDVRFEEGDVTELPFETGAIDYVVAFDIFEHLSLASMRQAISEAMRVARSGMVLSFFNMVDKPEHVEEIRKLYHWNKLSAPKIVELLESTFERVTAYHIPTLLRKEHGAVKTHNERAWTIVAEDG